MTTYASNTTVDSSRSRAEIERTLIRYGASGFMYGWDETQAVVGFIYKDRQVRFVLPLPDRKSKDFTHTVDHSRVRTATQQTARYEQAVRQRWRALALVVKAKLEAVEAGIMSFDQEFAMHFVLPNGQTVAEWVLPTIVTSYELGQVPRLALPESKGDNK